MADEDKKDLTVIGRIDSIVVNTKSNNDAVKVEQNIPTAYRLARKKDGTIVLQGAYQWSQGLQGGFEWREVQMVDFDTGQPIFI